MNFTINRTKILALAIFEFLVLLAGQLGSSAAGEPSVRTATHLALARHNQALAVLGGRTFDPAEAMNEIAYMDRLFGKSFVQRISDASSRTA
ncbi:hypothetical protein D9M68_979970 [compost metagenome]